MIKDGILLVMKSQFDKYVQFVLQHYFFNVEWYKLRRKKTYPRIHQNAGITSWKEVEENAVQGEYLENSNNPDNDR